MTGTRLESVCDARITKTTSLDTIRSYTIFNRETRVIKMSL